MTRPFHLIQLDLDTLRDQRTALEKEHAEANRNATWGAVAFLVSILLFWFSTWYLVTILLFVGGLAFWISGALGRRRTKAALTELEGKVTALRVEAQSS